MSKRRRGGKKRPKRAHILLDTSDKSYQTKPGRTLLKLRGKVSRILERILAVPDWDDKLKMPFVRIALFGLPSALIDVHDILDPLGWSPLIRFEFLGDLTAVYAAFYTWLGAHPNIKLIFMAFIGLSFLAVLRKHLRRDEKLRKKVTLWLFVTSLWDIYSLHKAAAFFIEPTMRAILEKGTVGLGILTVIYLVVLKFVYQRKYGSYDPERDLKKALRFEKRANKTRA